MMDYALIYLGISLGILSGIVIDIFRIERNYKKSRRVKHFSIRVEYNE